MLVPPSAFCTLYFCRNRAVIILLLIGVHFIKGPFALALIMIATPPCCTSSSPMYTPSLYSAVLLIPSLSTWPLWHFNPLLFHLLRYLHWACCLCDGPRVLATDDRLLLGGYYGAYPPLGFPLALSQERHCRSSSDIPSQCYKRFHFLKRLVILCGRVVSTPPNAEPGESEGHSLSGLYPLSFLAWVALRGVQDSSWHSSACHWDTQTSPPW